MSSSLLNEILFTFRQRRNELEHPFILLSVPPLGRFTLLTMVIERTVKENRKFWAVPKKGREIVQWALQGIPLKGH